LEIRNKEIIVIFVKNFALNHYAFVDSQNVNLSIRRQGWVLSWSKFRIYLKEKYHAKKAYLFIGYIPGNQLLYSSLQQAGITKSVSNGQSHIDAF